jgi:hypothetical protein
VQDGLTQEEMSPYIQRVLDQPNNWMVHSTGLLERSWLEYEKRRTMDRALLQVDTAFQHSMRLLLLKTCAHGTMRNGVASYCMT